MDLIREEADIEHFDRVVEKRGRPRPSGSTHGHDRGADFRTTGRGTDAPPDTVPEELAHVSQGSTVDRRAATWGVLAVLVALAIAVLGSGNLRWFDAVGNLAYR